MKPTGLFDARSTRPRLEAVLHFDGSCFPNPGQSRAAFVLRISNGKLVERGIDLGLGTNNTAEYNACILGLEAALAEGVTHIEVYGDSQLVIKGLRKGPWKGGKPHLEVLKARGIALLKKFDGFDLNWIPREQNTEADELSMATQFTYQ